MDKMKRIFAIAGCVILVAMYLITFVSAFLATPQAHSMFLMSIAATVIIPIFIYAYTLIYKVIRGDKKKYDGESDEQTDSQKAFDEANKKY